jgi:uncharacterized protein (TIGR00369 family)
MTLMNQTRTLAQLFADIGLRDVTGSDGELAMEMPVTEQVVNTAGGLQGGLIATLADVAAGRLAVEGVSAGSSVVTSDLFLRYLEPITEGSARAIARILRAGRRSVVVQVEIFRVPANELAAVATVSFAVVRRPDGSPSGPRSGPRLEG